MNNDNGGLFSDTNRRKTAAEIAREKVLAVYSAANDYEPSHYSHRSQTSTAASEPSNSGYTPRPKYHAATDYDAPSSYAHSAYDNSAYHPSAATTPTRQQQYQAPTNSPQPTEDTSALKDVPVNQTAVATEWQKYHSAWQNYYQNYYSEYYAKAAQNYLATEKLKNERVASGAVRQRRRVKHLVPIFVLVAIILSALFLQYNRLIFAPIMAYVSPNTESAPTSIEAVDPNVTGTVTADPRLIIPKINVDVPVSFDIPYTETFDAMLHGVAQFKIPGASALPGQIGNLVISGHSAGDIYSSNPYKFIFSGLERLEPGDLIYINYESTRYTYQMTSSVVVEPTNVDALIYATDRPVLTLITCTPLGTSRYRLLVTAEQISPDYDGSMPELPTVDADDTDISMPANEPSFFENLWNGLFGN